ncbi:hypothetical protein IGI04_036155 [Brassica rapa subsp. trilocularis]|uniref:Uncharacterized protein n=1 Tax=Brassica rapa subsp. trilocularis TaxID=1813537 RepID=A0ABQ7LGF4_BRACM|nr:hypothetical protein IGI04_036155 [Brassica rapa subsp. trilocularis]
MGCLFSTQRWSVGVRQHTQDVRGCPCVSISTHRTSVAFHQYTYQHVGPWTQHAGPSRGLTSVGVRQHTQDICGCPWLAHIGRPWLSVCVRVCPSAQARGCPCVSVSTHRMTVAVCVCPSAHTGRLWLSINTHISTLVSGLSTMAVPVDCLGDFGPRGLSVQYTQDVRGCPPTHTGRLLLSVSKHRTSVSVRVCPCVSVSTHKMSVAVHKYKYQHAGPWTQHGGPSRGLSGTHRTSVGVRQRTQDICVCPSAHTGRPWVSVDCLGDFVPRGLSVQYTQDVRGCPPTHTGRLLLSVSKHRTSVAVRVCPCVSVSTHKMSVAVHQYTYQHAGRWTQHGGPSRGLFGTSVGVRQHKQDVRVCSSAHTGRPWLSVCVRVCPSEHTGHLWLSISPSRGLWLILAHVGCLFRTHRTSVGARQHTHDIRGCPWLAHTGRLWLSVCIRVCPCVSVSTDRTSVGVRQHTHDVPVCPSAHTGYLWLSVCVCQHTQDVCGCPSVHISARWSLDSARWPFPWTVWVIFAHVGCLFSTPRTSVGVRQHTQNVCGCLWLSVSKHRTSVAVRVCPCVSVTTHKMSVAVHHAVALPVDCSGNFGPRGLSVQYPQDVHVCLSAHTGRLCVSVSTHISTLVVGLSMLTLPVDCLGDFGPRGLSVQYTQDVCGCPPAHTGSPWLSVSKHRTFVAVRVCPCVSVSTHKTSVALHQYIYQHAGPWTQHGGPSRGLFGTSVGVRQHTQDVRVCPSAHTGRSWLSVCVRVCPSAHTGPLWLSISTHISTLVLGLSTLTLPVDCLGDFCPRGLFVQYTQDVRGCPPAHTERLWLSVAVCQQTQDVRSCPCVSVCVRHHTQDVCGCPSVDISARWSLESARWPFPWTVRDVHVCLSAHTGRLCVSVSTHISTLVVGLSMLTLPVDCLGDFGPRGLSVQYTQDVCGCPPAHTGSPWLSVSKHRTFVAVRVCPCVSVSTHKTSVALHQYIYQHAGPWTQHGGPSRGLFGTSVGVRQHTQDVRVCPSAHTGRSWLFVCVRVCPSAHTGRQWLSISTHISTLVLGLSTLTLPVDCLGDFGPRGLSVQYTQDVCGCPPAHTGNPWLSVSKHRTSSCQCVSVSTHMTSVVVHQYTNQHAGPWTRHGGPSRRPWVSVSTNRMFMCVCKHTQDVCGCPCVSVSTHGTSVAVHQYTYQHVGPWTQHADPSLHTRSPWVSASTHRTSLAVHQHTHDFCGCPCVSVRTHMTSVAVYQYTYQHAGPWTQHAGPWTQHAGPWTQHAGPWTQHAVLTGRPWVSASTHRTSVAVCGCPSAHTRRPWLSVCVRVCPSAHTGCLWLSISTDISTLVLGVSTLALPVDCSAHTGRPWLSISPHISTLVNGLSTLALPVDCLGDFGPRGLSVQYTQDVCGCPPAHTGHLWVSVAVRVCPCVSVSTYKTSVGVRQDTQDVRVCPSAHTGCPWLFVSVRHHTQLSISTHLSMLFLGLSTLALPVDCLGDFGPRGLFVQYTQDVRGCPPAHTGRLWLSVSKHRTYVAVRVCPCVSVSTHKMSVPVHKYTYQHAGPWTRHGGPSRGLFGTSVGVRQHTQDICVCPSPHTGRPWLSMCVRLCPSAHTGRPWLSISTHISTLVFGLSTLTLLVDCSYTRDVRGYLPAHTGRLWLSVCVRVCPCVSVSTFKTSVGVRQDTQDVRVCPSAHTGYPWLFVSVRHHTQLSISTHLSTLVLGLSTLALPVDCLGDFGPRGLSVQYTQDVRGCPPAHTGRLWLSVSKHRTYVAVRVCPCVSVSTHTRCPCLSISTHISTLVLGLGTVALPVDCSGDFGPRELSVQYTQDVCGCPSAHTGHLCVSVTTHRTSVAVHVCPFVSVSTHRMSVAVHQYTYQHVGLWTQHADPSRGLFVHTGRPWVSASTHRTSVAVRVCPCVSVCVRQQTQDVRGCPSVHISAHWSLDSARWPFPWTAWAGIQATQMDGLRFKNSDWTGWTDGYGAARRTRWRGRWPICSFPWTVRVILAHVGCLFSTHRTSVGVHQHTQDVSGCLWLSVSTHMTSMAVRVCPCMSVSRHRTYVAVYQYTYQHAGPWTQHTALPVDCSGDFGPRGLSVQYTQDVLGCPSAHTGRPWLSVCVRVCSCVSVSTHRTSMAVYQYTYQHAGPWTQHAGPWSQHAALPVDCSGDFGPRGLSVQYTQDVRGFPPAHTGHPLQSVAISQHTQNVCGCPCVSVYVLQHTHDVRGCPSVYISARWSLD